MNKIILSSFAALLTIVCNGQNVQTATNGLYYDPTSGTTPRVVGLGGTLIQNTTIDLGSSYDLYFKKGVYNYLSIANNGNVVINDVSGEEKLTIFSGNILMKGPGGLNTPMGALKFSYYYSPGAWAGISGITNSGGVDQLDLAFYTAYGSSSEMMRIMSATGFVGIGTSTPQVKLDINGSGGSGISLQTTGRMQIKSPNAGIYFHNGTEQSFIGYESSIPNHAFGVFATGAGTWAMNLLQNGNLGIGTLAPTQKLDVAGNIYTSGKIGIGTSNISDANYRLFVETGIRTRKVKVDQATWPDYVFDPSYQLPSLGELETFIQKNKHLPDVPSADEVQKEGLNLGDNQAVLLKKIEELTLYIIDINKKTEVLMKENTALKEAILQK